MIAMKPIPPIRLLIAVALGLAARSGLAAAEPASPAFHDLTFEAAAAKAATEQKIVFIDFFTTWCAPCKMLDTTTWQDAKVIALLRAKAVALKLDAEQEKDLAARYKIGAYPSLLLLKPDGTEIDRIVGYRDATKFIEDFTAGLAGKGSAQRSQEAVVNAVTDQDKVKARYDLGKNLAQQGKGAEALAEFLWCYDEGMVQVASFLGVRNSFLLGDIAELGERFPPARAALVERRDRLLADFLANQDGRSAPHDLGALNRELGEDDKTLALFDRLPASDKRRRALGTFLLPQLLKARRYADALSVQPYSSMIQRAAMTATPPNAEKLPAEALATLRRFQINWFAERIEILAGAGELDQAREFLAKAMAYDSSEAASTAYRAHLERAGHAELFSPPPAAAALK